MVDGQFVVYGFQNMCLFIGKFFFGERRNTRKLHNTTDCDVVIFKLPCECQAGHNGEQSLIGSLCLKRVDILRDCEIFIKYGKCKEEYLFGKAF